MAGRLSERVVAREAELRDARGELDRLRADHAEAVRALARLVDRIELAGPEPSAEAETQSPESGERDEPEAAAAPGAEPLPAANGNGNGGGPARDPAELFAGLVEVEVGPLRDFAQLVGFEDAAGAIGAADFHVKRFAKGRATIELELAEPVALLRELEERAPFEFRVRDTRSDRVVLDLDGE